MKRTPAKPKAQKDTFEEVARRLECDDDKERFEARFGALAKSKPAPKKKR
jgi:hypothetical protein